MTWSHRPLAAVATIVLVAGCSSPESPPVSSPAPAASPAPLADTGPRASEHGVPVGWARDAPGARAAAASAVALTGDLVTAGFISRADKIGVLASVDFAPTLTADTATQLRGLLGDLAEDGVTASELLWRELPLTAEIVDIDDSGAVVRVWAVVVAGAPGRGAARQAWRTITVELVWERDDWRIDGWTATVGPTPALANNLPIASFDELAVVTAWPAAGGE